MDTIILPNINHANVTLNERNRIAITMDEGWVFWDKEHYDKDENGNFTQPLPEEIICFRYGVYAPDTDFNNRIVVIAETEAIEIV